MLNFNLFQLQKIGQLYNAYTVYTQQIYKTFRYKRINLINLCVSSITTGLPWLYFETGLFQFYFWISGIPYRVHTCAYCCSILVTWLSYWHWSVLRVAHSPSNVHVWNALAVWVGSSGWKFAAGPWGHGTPGFNPAIVFGQRKTPESNNTKLNYE